MSQEDYPVDFILESIESAMAPPKQPKVLLFDVGGVCVSLLPMYFLFLDSLFIPLLDSPKS
jgi:hypothetical protein